jgi:hypothetical protein
MKTKILRKTFLTLGVAFASLTLAHAQNLYVSVNGPLGQPNGSISEYTPDGTQITFASGISSPRGVAFDSTGNLYATISTVVDDHLVCKVVKFNSRRRPTAIGGAPFYGTFEGIATDAVGNVYVLSFGGRYSSTIFKFVPSVSRSVFGTVPGEGFGLAIDGAGNLYAADSGSDTVDATIYKFAPDGTRTVFVGPSAFADETFPVGLAFDSSGNLFVSTEGDPGSDTILKFTPTGTESTFATGLTQPRGLAFDAAGNLFVAETLAAPNGDILKFTPDGTGTVFATGIDRPEFLAFGPSQ